MTFRFYMAATVTISLVVYVVTGMWMSLFLVPMAAINWAAMQHEKHRFTKELDDEGRQ